MRVVSVLGKGDVRAPVRRRMSPDMRRRYLRGSSSEDGMRTYDYDEITGEFWHRYLDCM